MGTEQSGLDDAEQMFALVGMAITTWGYVEERLSEIFVVCAAPIVVTSAGAPQIIYGQPQHIFFSMDNLWGRLSLIDAALNEKTSWAVDTGQAIRDKWKRLKEKTRKKSNKRNKLAHWNMHTEFMPESQKLQSRLVPTFGSHSYYSAIFSNDCSSSIKKADLNQYIESFRKLANELDDFKMEILKNEELLEESLQRLAGHILLLRRSNPKASERLNHLLTSQ